MLLSIIIPVYNAEKYIDRCISSVVNQSLKDIEIVLINDGSTDNSLSLCRAWELKDKRIKLISQSNSGVSAARNSGIDVAIGEYLMFLDSDDYMFPKMCETMCEVLIKNNTDCIICGTMETGGGLWSPQSNIDYLSFEEFKKNFVYHLKTELLSPCWNKIFKKKLITEFFNEAVSFGEDLIFCLNYFKNCRKISFIPDALLFHETNVSGSLVSKVNLNRLLDIEKVHNEILSFSNDDESIEGLHNKYVRDIAVYLRMFFLNTNLSINEKKKGLDLWIKTSYLKKNNLCNFSCCFSNKILLFLAKYRFWDIINLFVNRK